MHILLTGAAGFIGAHTAQRLLARGDTVLSYGNSSLRLGLTQLSPKQGLSLGLTAALFLLVFLQPLFADPELHPQWLRSLHVLNALFIFALGYHLAQRGERRSET